MEDPQARHLQLQVSAPHPQGGEWHTIRSPVSFDGERPLEVSAPPLLGADNAAIVAPIRQRLGQPATA